jgi:hypothetical protein
MTRSFTSHRAVRANVPLLIALIGPSTSGKTFSAHRLAAGIQRVQPGPIYGIDTENRGTRMLELADRFSFQHMPFEPPFGSLDYLAAMQQAAREGARTVIVDSMSHEHEGEGGMLDSAEQYVEEKIRRKVENKDLQNAHDWKAEAARAKLKISSFIQPKAHRSKLIQGMLQLNINVILCFRAKEKIEPQAGKEPIKLGWQPIAGDEFWYEMTTRCLLLPGANGVPTWDYGRLEKGEKVAVRCPEQFKDILRPGAQLNEDMGEAMARWASGNVVLDLPAQLAKLSAAPDTASLKAIAAASRSQPWTDEQRGVIREAIETKRAELGAANPGTDEKKGDT